LNLTQKTGAQPRASAPPDDEARDDEARKEVNPPSPIHPI
jgi:hypothetical protein